MEPSDRQTLVQIEKCLQREVSIQQIHLNHLDIEEYKDLRVAISPYSGPFLGIQCEVDIDLVPYPETCAKAFSDWRLLHSNIDQISLALKIIQDNWTIHHNIVKTCFWALKFLVMCQL